MGFFRRDLKKAMSESRQALDAQLQQVLDLPPTADLAAEIMGAFGGTGPKPGKPLTHNDIVKWMSEKYEFSSRAQRFIATDRLREPIREALQILEHAELVLLTVETEGTDNWRLTSKGRTTLSGGKALVQQYITERTAAPISTAVRLEQLEALRAGGLLSDDEYTAKRQQIIDEL